MITIIDKTDYAAEVQSISIVRAEYIGAYKLHLWFADGKNHTVDFEPFLLHARNLMTTKYHDKKLFQNFTVEHGNIHWNDYEMCFESANLYSNPRVEYKGFG